MKKFLLLTFIALIACTFTADAQRFLRPFELVSKKKPSYVTTTSGEEIETTIEKLKRKKGLIKTLMIEGEDGKKTEMPIEEVAFAYFPQSGLDKLGEMNDFVENSITKWSEDEYDMGRIQEGYAYFETVEVEVGKKTRPLIMQLVNPGTCSRLRVYHDPYAKETASVGVAGVKLAGGEDKSYYISKDGATAFKIEKKNLKKVYNDIFGDCKTVNKKYDKIKWGNFEEMVFLYNAECEK